MKAIERTCAIAYSLNLLGDKWSLLILRDVILHKKSKFKDFIDDAISRKLDGLVLCAGKEETLPLSSQKTDKIKSF